MRRRFNILVGRCCVAASIIALAGCSTAVKHGDIVEVDSTVFGFNVAASASPSETPAVQFGLIRERVLFIPTSTNGPISAPPYNTAGDINNNGRTLLFGAQDSSSTTTNR